MLFIPRFSRTLCVVCVSLVGLWVLVFLGEEYRISSTLGWKWSDTWTWMGQQQQIPSSSSYHDNQTQQTLFTGTAILPICACTDTNPPSSSSSSSSSSCSSFDFSFTFNGDSIDRLRARLHQALEAHAQTYLAHARARRTRNIRTRTGTATALPAVVVPPATPSPSPSLSLALSLSRWPSIFPLSVDVPVVLRSVHGRCSFGKFLQWNSSHIQKLLHKPDYNISQGLQFVRYGDITTTLSSEQDQLGRGEVTWDDYGARVSHPCMFPLPANPYPTLVGLEMKPARGEPEGVLHNHRDEFHTEYEYVSASRVGFKYLPGRWMGWTVGTFNMWHGFVDDMINVFCLMDLEHVDYIVQLPATPIHSNMRGAPGFIALLGVAWLSYFPHVKIFYYPDELLTQRNATLCIDHITYPKKLGNRVLSTLSYLTRDQLERLRTGVYRILGVGDAQGNLPEADTNKTTAENPNKSYRITVYDRKDSFRRVWMNGRDVVSRIAPHHRVLYIDDITKVSAQDQLRIYANTDILIAIHGAGQMATLFLPRCAITLQLTSWWDLDWGYLGHAIEYPHMLNLKSATMSCHTYDSKPFSGNTTSRMRKQHRNGEHTLCTSSHIFHKILTTWGIDLTRTIPADAITT